MEMTQEQVSIFRDALERAREELRAAEKKKVEIANQELAIGTEIWRLQRLIDALEIQLGEATEAEVFARNKRKLSKRY